MSFRECRKLHKYKLQSNFVDNLINTNEILLIMDLRFNCEHIIYQFNILRMLTRWMYLCANKSADYVIRFTSKEHCSIK